MGTIYVGPKKIPVDEALYNKIMFMIKRCTQKKPKRDALLNNEGEEGIGKTTLSLLEAYIIHVETGRSFSNANVFFDVGKAIRFAQNTESQIIIFDEPASDVLSAEWWKETQKNLIKLLMMARKKRHFFIFNFTKFWKFNEYIVVDRALGMVHLYVRSDESTPRFVYIRKKKLQLLFNDFRTKKQRNYYKYYSFRGTFPDILDKDMPYNILDMFNAEEYDKEKDKAIMDIGKKEKKTKELKRLIELKYKLGRMKIKGVSGELICSKLGITPKTLKVWSRIDKKDFEEPTKDSSEPEDPLEENEEFLESSNP